MKQNKTKTYVPVSITVICLEEMNVLAASNWTQDDKWYTDIFE